MKGTVIDFNQFDHTGLISGEDGNRYPLTIYEWKGEQGPKIGLTVDFFVQDGQATAIYPLPSSKSSKKIVAALLAFFFGSLGVHKFYLGYIKQGLIMLFAFLLGFLLLGIPSAIIGIIAFVEFLIYVTRSDEEFEQIYILSRKPWF
ncbi:MAG: TM2 domain-containing protein [Vibrio metschnikovii]|nr:TM2 domain-containing protein [Vibrio metschnikovii]MDM7485064.1 TM2 domain-containing protein [Vibrio metschnikovii]